MSSDCINDQTCSKSQEDFQSTVSNLSKPTENQEERSSFKLRSKSRRRTRVESYTETPVDELLVDDEALEVDAVDDPLEDDAVDAPLEAAVLEAVAMMLRRSARKSTTSLMPSSRAPTAEKRRS